MRENEQNDCNEEQYDRSKYLTHALVALPSGAGEFSKHEPLAACRLQRDQEEAAESVKSSLVPPRPQIRSQEIYRRVLRRDPPLEGDATRARHGEEVAVLRGLGRVGGQDTVWPMVGDKFLRSESKAVAPKRLTITPPC